MRPVIQVNDLGKLYRLGEVGTGTISHDLKRWWAQTRGKEDPYAQVGVMNDRNVKSSMKEYVWALKDVSFSIRSGEVVGIIGRNGAGKSTLLKILSRITAPSKGRVRVKGRIGSLLEVGTGFHPEMTGRENIYMNGTVLGMRRHEIAGKFDEIVSFAGVEKYIDTPVKRYSSGMMVRLAFSVAAFLEPEILIIDEVLAVGDAEFQNKCLGKMKDVSANEGRTVVFVSHNMGVISQLCEKAMLMENGTLKYFDKTASTIALYLASANKSSSNEYNISDDESVSKDVMYLKRACVTDVQGLLADNIQFDENIYLEIVIAIRQMDPIALVSITLQNIYGDYLSTFVERLSDFNVSDNEIRMKIKLPSHVIAPNSYAFRIALFVPNGKIYEIVEMICAVKVIDTGTNMSLFEGINYGSFLLNYELVGNNARKN